MKRLLVSIALGLLLSVSSATGRTLVVGISGNLSSDARAEVNGVLGGIYDNVQPGDHVIFLDANRLAEIASLTEPAEGFGAKRAKARALGPVFQKVYDFTGASNDAVPVNDLGIPQFLVFVGRNIVPAADRKQAQVLLLGSIVFDDPQNAGFSFRDLVPSDGMLVQLNTVFDIAGRENSLTGALVSICYTDADAIRAVKPGVHTNSVIKFWGKMITGQGGHVGSIMTISPACSDRLFSDVASSEDFSIDRNAKPELLRDGWVTVPVGN
jgi:hypothetical protein